MTDFWLKIKIWTRVILLAIVGIMVLLFIAFNWNAEINPRIDLLFTRYEKPQLLVVLFFTIFLSILGWWLVWTVVATLRQLRETRERQYTQRLEREVAEIRARESRQQAEENPPERNKAERDTP